MPMNLSPSGVVFSSLSPSPSLQAMDPWADSTAPKMLADVFEALIGAIFVDSNYSLSRVWQVIEPLLREYIGKIIDDE